MRSADSTSTSRRGSAWSRRRASRRRRSTARARPSRRVGTSVLNLPYYNPLLLARQLTTLDVLSGGRLAIGLGTGWSPDEYEALGVPMNKRGAVTEEALDVLEALWAGGDTVEFTGKHFTVPRSVNTLKPAQSPRPPIYFAAYTERTMKRVALRADGWMPAGIPAGGLGPMWAGIRQMAEAGGRDPAALALVVRANVTHLPESIPEEGRFPFVGSTEQLKADIAAHRELGADELLFDVQFSPDVTTVDDQVAKLEQLFELAAG